MAMEYIKDFIYDPTSPEKDFDYYLIKFRYDIFSGFVKGDRVLELGSATGFSTFLLSQFVNEIVSVELFKKNIDLAKSFLKRKEMPGKIEFIQGNWMDIDSSVSEQFSDIVWFQGIEYVSWENAQRILKKLKKLLVDDGRMHIVASNRLSIHRRLGFYMNLIKDMDEFSERDIITGRKKWLADTNRLTKMVEETGYKIIHMEPYFLKPLPNSYMQDLPENIVYGFLKLGRELPEYCQEIYVCVEKG
jgi:SAM-dependent methyltransferase